MSELLNNGRKGFHWQLLTSASVIALLGAANWMDSARAADNDADRPLVWIELGGQAEQMSAGQELFTPTFASIITQNGYPSPTVSEQGGLGWMIGGNGKISFQPEASDWLFSASIRFGRANGGKSNHVEKTAEFTPKSIVSVPANGLYRVFSNPGRVHTGYSDTRTTTHESYTVLDFQAGKDVGVGRIGNDGTSEFGFGVRIAQFQSKSKTSTDADPNYHLAHSTLVGHYYYISGIGYVNEYKHRFQGAFTRLHASAQAARNFHGIGPSISWNASSPLMGNTADGELALDWGVNGAILFGRQRAQVHHQTTARYVLHAYAPSHYTISSHSANPARARTVVVPNAGGFAGLSYRFTNAKLSFGYRGDFFFGAMDGGIDTAKKENIAFYGPFATISVGFGG